VGLLRTRGGKSSSTGAVIPGRRRWESINNWSIFPHYSSIPQITNIILSNSPTQSWDRSPCTG